MGSQYLSIDGNLPPPGPSAGLLTYAGVFSIALSTLMYEILLTRIFSVTMYYHFAFMAISIAMFGMTVGGVVVYLHPAYSIADQTIRQMARCGLLFALWMVIGILTHVFVPFYAESSLRGFASMTLTFGSLSLAFVYSGICICLALTRFPRQVSSLYAADLAGAAAGCAAVIGVFKFVNGLGAVFVAALLAAFASILFSSQIHGQKASRAALHFTSLLAALTIINTVSSWRGTPLLDLIWVKGTLEGSAIYEKWNSFSRVRVFGDPDIPTSPVTEGTSPAYRAITPVRALPLTIDADAETIITGFAGDPGTVDYLRYDVKEIVHYIRPNSSILIIGAGGGRDVLAALAFDQKSVRAVEMNQDILTTINSRFGDYTGHLDRNPRITFVNDEARSYIARSKEKFDILQASFIDTWAATAAGAFALTENGLYTIEAWKIFLSRLTPRGVISFSRWFVPGHPQETYRLTALAAAALEQMGVQDPRGHLILVRNAWNYDGSRFLGGAATLLVSRVPFSDGDLDEIEAVARRMQFTIVLSPRVAADSNFADLASGHDLNKVMARLHFNIRPPTDNQPFFFQMGKFGDLFRPTPLTRSINEVTDAAHLLGTILLVITTLTILCIVLPLGVAGTGITAIRIWPNALFFAAIGMGFMLVEVSQMQRLMIFLGHPTYALSVVLFTLLLSSGLGSYTTQGVGDANLRRQGLLRIGVLCCVLCAFEFITGRVLTAFEGAVTPVRILAAIGLLFPLGFLMGMAFPLGMKAATGKEKSFTPWLWGINGGTSVCASVLAVVISVYAGIAAAFWAGTASYAVAWISFLQSGRDSAENLR